MVPTRALGLSGNPRVVYVAIERLEPCGVHSGPCGSAEAWPSLRDGARGQTPAVSDASTGGARLRGLAGGGILARGFRLRRSLVAQEPRRAPVGGRLVRSRFQPPRVRAQQQQRRPSDPAIDERLLLKLAQDDLLIAQRPAAHEPVTRLVCSDARRRGNRAREALTREGAIAGAGVRCRRSIAIRVENGCGAHPRRRPSSRPKGRSGRAPPCLSLLAHFRHGLLDGSFPFAVRSWGP